MDFKEFLMTCVKRDGSLLSARTIEHYDSGLKATSNLMQKEGIINKPLEKMDLFELDLAIELILRCPLFLKKDNKGNHMYSNALKRFRCFVSSSETDNQTEKNEIKKIENDPNLNITERLNIVKSRIGQGEYRERLLKKYNNECIITHIKIPEVLIASHIKPWAVSNNSERVNSNNGFILSATYDRLFDRGLISFENNGRILLSSMITSENAQILKLENKKIYDIKYNACMNDFLEYHRDVIFIK